VSWSDADAYARWMSQRTGYRYRLPSTADARALPSDGGSKPVSEWLRECSGGCSQRMTGGRSWRGAPAPRDAARGYDDVGDRLGREL
jgi:hypothetical protein